MSGRTVHARAAYLLDCLQGPACTAASSALSATRANDAHIFVSRVACSVGCCIPGRTVHGCACGNCASGRPGGRGTCCAPVSLACCPCLRRILARGTVYRFAAVGHFRRTRVLAYGAQVALAAVVGRCALSAPLAVSALVNCRAALRGQACRPVSLSALRAAVRFVLGSCRHA